jgi:outer membrane protease
MPLRPPRRLRRTLLAALALLPAAAASPADVSFTVSTSAGILNGTSSEIVYASAAGSTCVQSLLLWAMRPAFFTGSSLTVETGWGGTAGLSVRAAIPGLTGRVSDSDWKNYPYGGTEMTHLSVHDCHTEHAVLVDAHLGWALRLAPGVTLTPRAGFSLMMFKWTARDGWDQYPPEPAPGPYTPWSPDAAREPVSGTAVVFEQDWLIPSAGAELRLGAGGPLELAVSLTGSPYAWCFDMDNHEFRYGTAGIRGYLATDFRDATRGGFMVEPAASLRLRVGGAVVSFDTSYRWLSGLVGDTTISYAGPGWTPGGTDAFLPGGAGAACGFLTASLSLALSL